MKKAIEFENDYISLHLDVISAICDTLTQKKIVSVFLNNSPVYRTIDDQFSETVYRVDALNESITLDMGDDYSDVTMEDLDFQLLIAILKEIEGENYDVDEEIVEIIKEI